MTTKAKLGLIDERARLVPLTGVHIEARLCGSGVEVTMTQRYHNAESTPIEAQYIFPLDEGAALCAFSARIGDRLIHAQVEEREAAFVRYDNALLDGHRAFLLEQERPNVFVASVGNLEPGEMVDLQLRYVAVARTEGQALRLSIPTTVSPRYVPVGPSRAVGQPDGERINPERWPRVPYGLSLGVEVALGSPLRRLESPSHPIRATLHERGARVELSQRDVALDRDFVLVVEAAEPAPAKAVITYEAAGRREARVERESVELLFLLDCSASMQGAAFAQAKRALLLCLDDLDPDDHFDVVCFCARHEALWGRARPVGPAAVAEATRHLEGVSADRSGTELLPALRACLERPFSSKRERHVLLLTDGQVSNDAALIQLARQHAGRTRVHCVGVGAAPNEHLVRGIARASGGTASVFVPGEALEHYALCARLHGRGFAAPSHLNGGTVEAELNADGTPKDGTLPSLRARERIRELEEGPRPYLKRRAIRKIAQRYRLSSSETSFVAVEQRPVGASAPPSTLRPVPLALTNGWGEGSAAPPFGLGEPVAPFFSPTEPRVPSGPSGRRARALRASALRASGARAALLVPLKRTGAPALDPSGPEDPRFILLQTQQADGSFRMSKVLARWLGAERLSRLRDAVRRSGEALAVTAAVAALLAETAPERSGEWGAALLRAEAWLQNTRARRDRATTQGAAL